MAMAAAWLAVGLATLLLAIAIAYVGALGAPFWDQWRFADPTEYLSDLMVRHNSHPILTGRLLFAADYYWFEAQPWFLQFLIFAMLGAVVAAFVALARLAGWRGRTTLIAFAGFALAIIFNPQGWENLRWGFQAPFVLVFASAVVGAYALASNVAAPRAWKLPLSLLCSVLAIFSLANGALIALLLLVMSAYLRCRARVVGLYGLVAALSIPALTAPSRPPAAMRDIGGLAELTTYVLRYLGGGLGMLFDYSLRSRSLLACCSWRWRRSRWAKRF
jgi:hypothetical protein